MDRPQTKAEHILRWLDSTGGATLAEIQNFIIKMNGAKVKPSKQRSYYHGALFGRSSTAGLLERYCTLKNGKWVVTQEIVPPFYPSLPVGERRAPDRVKKNGHVTEPTARWLKLGVNSHYFDELGNHVAVFPFESGRQGAVEALAKLTELGFTRIVPISYTEDQSMDTFVHGLNLV